MLSIFFAVSISLDVNLLGCEHLLGCEPLFGFLAVVLLLGF